MTDGRSVGANIGAESDKVGFIFSSTLAVVVASAMVYFSFKLYCVSNRFAVVRYNKIIAVTVTLNFALFGIVNTEIP